MIYQKLLTGSQPYYVSGIRHFKGFHLHRHPEVEFFFCVEGNCSILINSVRRELSAGDLTIIGSMNAHEILPAETENCRSIAMEVGPVFLGEHFDTLAGIARDNPVLSLGTKDPLYRLIGEIQRFKTTEDPFAELSVRGLLFQFCAELLGRFQEKDHALEKGDLRAVLNIEQALELIYQRYASPLTVTEAAERCGYSQSNFCRMFRRITGCTFHQLLNRHRIQIACALLKESDSSIEEIAHETGFPDTKAFCRVFKGVTGITAGQYRRAE